MNNHILQDTDIENCIVVVDIMSNNGCISNIEIHPKYITIHNTGNLDMDAPMTHKNVKRTCYKCIRRGHTHFIVDDKYIYQAQIANIKCLHTGTKIGNESSIGIEICGFRDKEKQKKSYENTIKLVKILMEYYKIDIKDIKRHCDWSKSSCPIWLNKGVYGYTWDWFISQIKRTE